MGGWGIQDWVFRLTGVVLLLVGIAIGSRALFSDRSRGRKRCPKCWYSMDGVPESERSGQPVWICPECGLSITDDRRMFRTRRSGRRAALAAAVFVFAYASFEAPSWKYGRWTELLPTRAVLILAPDPQVSAHLLPSYPGRMWSWLRASSPNLTVAETLSAAAWGRVLAGRASREQSQDFIGRYLRAIGTSLGAHVRLPRRWIRGEPIPVLLRNPAWTRASSIPYSSVVVEGGRIVTTRADGDVSLIPGPGTGPLAINLELRGIGGVVLYSESLEAPFDLDSDPGALIETVDSAESSWDVRRAIGARLRSSNGELRLVVEDTSDDPRWAKITYWLAYRVDVVTDGKVVGTAAGGAAVRTGPGWKNWRELPINWAPGGEALVRAQPERAHLVFTGTPADTLRWYREWPFTGSLPTAWAGSFEVPVPEALEGASDELQK